MSGKFIVFEGADGSGKTTHAKLLYNILLKKKVPTAFISFPRYTDSVWGAMVRRYLNGDFGKLDPYLASMLYAGDRFSAAGQIGKWIENGKAVVCDRYIVSNIAHQGGKFKRQSERAKFTKWLEDLEYGENKIPKEDLVIFLDMPLEFSLRLMRGRKLDIHEADKNHLKNAIAIYQSFAKKKKNWLRINPVKDGWLLPIQEVSANILQVLTAKKILNGK